MSNHKDHLLRYNLRSWVDSSPLDVCIVRSSSHALCTQRAHDDKDRRQVGRFRVTVVKNQDLKSCRWPVDGFETVQFISDAGVYHLQVTVSIGRPR